MERSLTRYVQVLVNHEVQATFPFTASALERNRSVVQRLAVHHVEFAVHGYHHVDHKALSAEEQAAHLTKAAELFTTRGVNPTGFRSPYLRWNDHTIAAIEQAGFEYDSSEAIAWDVVDKHATERYERVLDFYGARSAADTPCVPRRAGNLIRIPYCLPDDEALADRLDFEDLGQRDRVWIEILSETHRRGELFTLGLHPERFGQLEQALVETLRAAKDLVPTVWIARLDEIARWWKARTESTITVDEPSPGVFKIRIDGPDGVTPLTRNIERIASEPPGGADRRARDVELLVSSPVRPFVGVSHRSPKAVPTFLREQGYIVEEVEHGRAHGSFIDRPQFDASHERDLLAELERHESPLVWLGRWPNGAQSALSITGDIDALTLWDYIGRFKRG
ncbi:MAG: polysaccharide deacetylase family protein [Acidimicrobiia bacterium]|nr:polysaccharide deacetylase family protein [Acidimicrobiia bacterium]